MPLPDPSFEPALQGAAEALGLTLDAQAADRLLRFLALLQRWNATYNLTAVRDPKQMVTQHLADCLAVVPPLKRQLAGSPARLLDVGSGAGLPGVVIAVMASEVEVTCAEVVGKKAAFIRQVAGELALANLRVEQGRVEEGSGRFDVVTSRAFATLEVFTACTVERLQRRGVWMAMKAKRPDAEILELRADVEVFHVEQLDVPGLSAQRCLVWMRPVSNA